MIPVIPLAVAGVLAVVAFAMASKDEKPGELGPGPSPLPPGPEPNAGGATTPTPAGNPKPVGPTPAGVQPATAKSAPAGALPAGTAINTGDQGVVHADDAFDQAVADALAKHDVTALEALAAQAEKMGLLAVARSIRDEIARIKGAAPAPTPPLPDKPPLTNKLATYVVQAGDTGEKIADKFVHNKSRWTELVTVNPTLKDPKYGLKIYAGQRINLPASWPAGVPVLPPTPVPQIAPSLPAAPPSLNTYTVIAGDTGEKVAQKFTGNKGRWTELLTVNPTLKSAQYGIALYTGHKINLPASWPATAQFTAAAPAPLPVLDLGSPAPVPPPAFSPPPMPTAPPAALPESDARLAAKDITAYLTSIGGLAGRYKEDKVRVKAWQDRMGGTAVPSDGKYGRGSATAVMVNGLVPVAPYYWPSTNTQKAKSDFIALVKNYAAADPQRKSQWDKLLADTVRS